MKARNIGILTTSVLAALPASAALSLTLNYLQVEDSGNNPGGKKTSGPDRVNFQTIPDLIDFVVYQHTEGYGNDGVPSIRDEFVGGTAIQPLGAVISSNPGDGYMWEFTDESGNVPFPP